MPGLADCLSFLRLLIARGDPKGIPLAENAIDDYLAMAPISARRSGLRTLQQDAWELHGTAVGVQRSFAETVDAYIERKLSEEEGGAAGERAAISAHR
ncbi:hypothetical protein [Bradyrhizobium commune]|uniref:Uncharacterized protein n=1 Tax=Bradyrhizobium commune TaxID=83627 RepID=A0A7S9DB93_9BRAD|nr:hypothetical protein [Bradyrhizobium commune]QPF93754.1 hypothetical protein IC761_11010 [Bradyrhizobium commune]